MHVHCQVCGRAIKAKAGIIAHHGYTRPGWGWQTGSCPGARAMPWEESSKALAAYISDLHGVRERYQIGRDRVDREEVPATWYYTDKNRDGRGQRKQVSVSVTRKTFDDEYRKHAPFVLRYAGDSANLTFAEVKKNHLKRAAEDIRRITETITHLKARLETWRQTATFNGVEFVALEQPK